MRKARDNSYWLPRLEREFPAIFARLKAGDILSVRQACAEAGLIHLPSRLDALKREWKRATAAEQEEFRRWVASGSGTPTPGPRHEPIANADRRLTTSGVARIEAALLGRGFGTPREWHTAPLMKELGCSPFDASVGLALRGARMKSDLIDDLEAWLTRNGY